MTHEPNLYNPIGWAHFSLRGGMRNSVTVTIGYTLLMTAIIFATVRFNPLMRAQLLSMWTFGLMGIGASILLIYGCVTVTMAVRLDHTSKMIESHRVMPTGASSAILGYVFGASAQALLMALANFAIGAVLANSAQVAFRRWAMAYVILISFSIFAWVMVVFFGFLAQTAFRWIVTVFIIAFWISQGYLIRLLPGLTILLSPVIGHSIFSMRSRSSELSWEYIASGIAQILVGGICFVGATRKYRRGDAPALGTELGLLLLAVWIGLSLFGIGHWEDLKPAWLMDETDVHRHVLATLVATLLVMIIPIAGAARAAVRWKQRLEIHDVVLPRRPVSPLLVALAAAALPLVLTLMLNFSGPRMLEGTIRTAIVFLSFALTISYLLRMLPLSGKSVWVVPIIWIIVSFGVPIFIDLIYHGFFIESEQTSGMLSTLSPPAAIFDMWSSKPVGTNFGLAVQAAGAFILMVMFNMRRRFISPAVSQPSPTP